MELEIGIFQELTFLFRLLLSSACGMAIGWERENKLKSAGIRTHMVIALAASLMMIIFKFGFMDVIDIPSVGVEVSHIALGVVQTIGFIGAGVIFVKGDTIVVLTTAAGLWATVGIGLAIGSDLYVIGVFSTIFILVIQFVLHNKGHKSIFTEAGKVEINLTKHNLSIEDAEKKLKKIGIIIRSSSINTNKKGESVFYASVMCSSSVQVLDTVDQMVKTSFIDAVSIYSID